MGSWGPKKVSLFYITRRFVSITIRNDMYNDLLFNVQMTCIEKFPSNRIVELPITGPGLNFSPMSPKLLKTLPNEAISSLITRSALIYVTDFFICLFVLFTSSSSTLRGLVKNLDGNEIKNINININYVNILM